MKRLLGRLLLVAALPVVIPGLPSLGAETRANGSVTGRVVFPEGYHMVPRMAPRYRQFAGVRPDEPAPLAVVYLEPQGPLTMPPPPADPEPAVMKQAGLQFDPLILPVRTGTPVAFPNRDQTYHNVFSYSGTGEFDLGRYLPQEEPPQVVFTDPGVIRLYCEIHRHMRAVILVLDTAWFTQTGAGGSFLLEDVPPGTYRAVCFLKPDLVWEQMVRVTAGETAELRFGPEGG
ncbi:MAG: cupredoxin domain-containing protein [Opitutales bacterium]